MTRLAAVGTAATLAAAGVLAAAPATADDAAPAPPGLPVIVGADSFSRTVESGWGKADQGGTWAHVGVAGTSVSDGVGRVVAAPGTGVTSWLRGISASSTDVSVVLSANALPGGSGSYQSIQARQIGNLSYSAQVRIDASGGVRLELLRSDGSDTRIVMGDVKGLTFAPDTRLALRVQALGTSPTVLRAKVWQAGTSEPTAWTQMTTDDTPALQQRGTVGLHTYLSAASPATVTFTYDDLRATVPPPGEYPDVAANWPADSCGPACNRTTDSFTTPVTNGWGTTDNASPWSVSAPAQFSVKGGTGQMQADATGRAQAWLPGFAVSDMSASVEVKVPDTVPSSGTTYLTLSGAQSAPGTHYNLVVGLDPAPLEVNGMANAPQFEVASVYLAATVDGNQTRLQELGSQYVSLRPGDRLGLSLTVAHQEAGTFLIGNVSYLDGGKNDEPTLIVYTVPENTYVGPGSAGVSMDVSGTVADAPLVTRWDSFTLKTPVLG